MTLIRVLVVDDHGVMRAGLKALIEAQNDMEVVGEARDGKEAVAVACEKEPDVVVIDLELPVLNGIDATRLIRKRCHQVRVLALTMHDEQGYVQEVIAAGGTGYVVKDALGDELISAIRAVNQGRTYINVPLSSASADGILSDQPDSASATLNRELEALSEREQQVLDLLAQGFTNQQIGKELHLSPKTIGTYRYRISNKLGLETRADIVRFALETGILKPSQ